MAIAVTAIVSRWSIVVRDAEMVTWSSVDGGAGVVGAFRMRKPTTDTAATITTATIARATILPRRRPPRTGATGVTGDSPADMPTPLPTRLLQVFRPCYKYASTKGSRVTR